MRRLSNPKKNKPKRKTKTMKIIIDDFEIEIRSANQGPGLLELLSKIIELPAVSQLIAIAGAVAQSQMVKPPCGCTDANVSPEVDKIVTLILGALNSFDIQTGWNGNLALHEAMGLPEWSGVKIMVDRVESFDQLKKILFTYADYPATAHYFENFLGDNSTEYNQRLIGLYGYIRGSYTD